MKKLYAIIISLLFVVSVFGVVSFAATPTDPRPGTSTYSATPEIVNVGEFITVKNHITGEWSSHTPIQNFTIYGTGGVVKISGPTPSYVPFVAYGSSIDVVWVYKATGAGTVAFGSEDSIYTNYVRILPKSTPMEKFMKILGFGQKD
ncbi:MAG: hypothetical protein GYA60_10430 [Candidatus Methanofastidiosa archaeon]|nr:hypothetical protein [Candidatus Methanofastidiosa archaeon]